MKRISLLVALLFALVPPTVLPAQDAQQEVRAVVDRLFDGMRAADAEVVRSVFHPEARLVTTGVRDGQPVVRSEPIEGFAAAVGNATEVLDERLHDVEVRVDDNLATVWAPYRFYVGERFSHCGVNAFQLVRTAEGWRILQIVDTRRREGCGV